MIRDTCESLCLKAMNVGELLVDLWILAIDKGHFTDGLDQLAASDLAQLFH